MTELDCLELARTRKEVERYSRALPDGQGHKGYAYAHGPYDAGVKHPSVVSRIGILDQAVEE